LLIREPGSATRKVTERVLRNAGVKFSVAMELDHIEAIKQAVLAGLGVTASGRAFVTLLERPRLAPFTGDETRRPREDPTHPE